MSCLISSLSYPQGSRSFSKMFKQSNSDHVRVDKLNGISRLNGEKILD